MIDKTIAIAALARDCEKNLPRNITRMEKLGNSFSGSYFFVYENNSSDSTRSILKEWSSQNPNVFIMCEDLDESNKKNETKVGPLYRGASMARMIRMCNCRNKLLTLIKDTCSPDIVVFVDSDVQSFSVEGIVDAIRMAPSEWGALYANCYMLYTNGHKTVTSKLYYDTYPYIKKGRSVNDIKPIEISSLYRFFVACKLYNISQKKDFYECESGFGGIGVYKFDDIKDLNYDIVMPPSWEGNKLVFCDHVFLNTRMKSKKYIANSIRVCYNITRAKGLNWFLLSNYPRLTAFIILLKSLI